MTTNEMTERTRKLALRVIRVVQSLPKSGTASVIGGQLLRSGTAVGAHYRAACRSKSPADFAASMKLVGDAADEALYWLELLVESGIVEESLLQPLMTECATVYSISERCLQTLRTKSN